MLRHAKAQHHGAVHVCSYNNCSRRGRPFTRSDNLKDHIRRVHHAAYRRDGLAADRALSSSNVQTDELRRRIGELEKSMEANSCCAAVALDNNTLQCGSLSDQETALQFIFTDWV